VALSGFASLAPAIAVAKQQPFSTSGKPFQALQELRDEQFGLGDQASIGHRIGYCPPAVPSPSHNGLPVMKLFLKERILISHLDSVIIYFALITTRCYTTVTL
jgi:hypothetical protein